MECALLERLVVMHRDHNGVKTVLIDVVAPFDPRKDPTVPLQEGAELLSRGRGQSATSTSWAAWW